MFKTLNEKIQKFTIITALRLLLTREVDKIYDITNIVLAIGFHNRQLD